MHKSLLNKEGTTLDGDTLEFSFKKAFQNAKFYSYPVKITRVQKLKTSEIGYKETHQFGVEYKFWIAKKSSKFGLPAPLVLFFPKDGTQAKLSYVGSL